MFFRIIFEPPVSTQLIIGIGLIIAVVTIISYGVSSKSVGWCRKLILATLRLMALGLALLILMRPMALKPQQEALRKPVFCVLADCSESMNTKDVGEKSRYEAMIEALTGTKGDFIRKLSQDYNIKFYSFDKELRRTSLGELASRDKAQGQETYIAEALLNSIKADASKKPVGMLLISDGRSNEIDSVSSVRSAGRHLRAMNVPVWTVAVGTSFDAKDIYIEAKLSSNFIFIDQPASILVSVTGTGYANWYARINLYREDKYVTSEQVYLRSGHASISFPIREGTKGSIQYRVEVEPLAGETDPYNNERSLIAKVIDEKTRVLVVEARPYWDSKFLLRTLRADNNIEVTSIFYINPGKTFAIVEEFSDDSLLSKTVTPGVRMPRTIGELFKYDCIFLGKDIDTVFTTEELKLLRRYLTERGGGIVFYRGKSYSDNSPEIARIEPVEWGTSYLEDAYLELTREGKSSPIFDFSPHTQSSNVIVGELPAMKSVTKVTNEKSLAVILAKSKDGDDSEAIATVVYQRYGKGKVMSIGAAGLWQWAFLPEDLQEYDDIYQRFWGQMIRWIVAGSDFLPGQDISFLLDKYTYSPGETIPMSVNAKLIDYSEYKPWIELIGPDGETVRLEPKSQENNFRIYKAYFTPKRQGQYKAILHNNIGKPEIEEARFGVYQDSTELRYVSSDRELLEQLSTMTGGAMIEMEELSGLPEKIHAFERLSCVRVKPHDIWDRLSVYFALIGLLGCEWLIRRASAMV